MRTSYVSLLFLLVLCGEDLGLFVLVLETGEHGVNDVKTDDHVAKDQQRAVFLMWFIGWLFGRFRLFSLGFLCCC